MTNTNTIAEPKQRFDDLPMDQLMFALALSNRRNPSIFSLFNRTFEDTGRDIIRAIERKAAQ